MRRLAWLALAFALVGCDDESSSIEGPDPDMDVTPADMGPNLSLGLEVLTPTAGSFVVRRFDVTGRVTGVGAGQVPQVKVNGEDAEMMGFDFVGTITLPAGPQTFEVTAGDARVEVDVMVDGEPPLINITFPDRGTYIEDGQTDMRFTVTDDLGLDTLTLDDREIDSGLAPDFELRGLPLREGLNILQLEAHDVAGNTSREHVSALHGELRNADEPVASAIRAHIGTEGLNQIGRVASGILDSQDLSALVPMLPEAGGFAIEISSIGYQRPSQITLTPMPGELHARIVLNEFAVELALTIGGREAIEVGVGAGRIEVNAVVMPRVVDGQLIIEVAMLDIDFFDLQIGVGRLPGFEDDPGGEQSLLEEILSDTLTVVIEDRLPELIGSALTALDDPIDLALLGAMLQLQLRPNVAVVSERGLSIRIDVTVALLNPPAQEPAIAGYVGRESVWDGVPDTDQFGLAVDDDLLNALLYQVWRAGVLFPTIDQASIDEGGETLLFVSAFFGTLVSDARPDVPRNAPLQIATSLPLPIVAKVKKGGAGVGLEIGIGDLMLAIATDDADHRSLLNGAVSLVLSGELGVNYMDEALKLALNITDLKSAFDVLDEDLRGNPENAIERQIADLLGVIGPTISDLVGGFELPSLQGITLTDISVDAGGPDGDFIVIIAGLEN